MTDKEHDLRQRIIDKEKQLGRKRKAELRSSIKLELTALKMELYALMMKGE